MTTSRPPATRDSSAAREEVFDVPHAPRGHALAADHQRTVFGERAAGAKVIHQDRRKGDRCRLERADAQIELHRAEGARMAPDLGRSTMLEVPVSDGRAEEPRERRHERRSVARVLEAYDVVITVDCRRSHRALPVEWSLSSID